MPIVLAFSKNVTVAKWVNVTVRDYLVHVLNAAVMS